ncbi:MAG: sulfatase [Candidatus Schekmanbacteria bacterium]|nr:sulfatase [Candidatus Schekmanbacteria bacterium]
MKIVRHSPFRRIVIVLLLIAAAVSGAYFVFSRKGSDIITALRGYQNQYNVVLITIDTLRADRLGCYGYKKDVSPAIDKFAGESVRFENAIIQVPYTGPSHCSILTGKYAANHGVMSNGYKLSPDNITLAEVLKEYDYSTGAAIGAWVLKKMYDYNQGFDSYLEDKSGERRASSVNKDILPWIKNNKNKKFFAWIHYYDVHCAYNPPKKFKEKFGQGYSGELNPKKKCGDTYYNKVQMEARDVEYVKNMYDGEIAYTDSKINGVLKKLKKWGLFENTIIVITSDHGEELHEHGKFGHDYALCDYEVKVPLIIHYPGMKLSNRVVSEQVDSISIMPTILELLGIPSPDGIDGKSFANLLKGEGYKEEPAYMRLAFEKNTEHEYAVRTRDFKLLAVKGKGKELYNLKDDPNEDNNLVSRINEFPAAAALSDSLDKFMANEEKANIEHQQNIQGETVEKLKSLGYLQ